ncbi:MAG: GNAT family N-acetyltransferase [Bacteroidota bacterium]
MSLQIREATPADAGRLSFLINALADYEHLSHESNPDAAALARHLSPDAQPRCHALVAEQDGEVIGMALYFFNYSTFLTRWNIFLEDLFVLPDFRGTGTGFALLKALARVAVAHNCERLDWNVLDWNQLAIDFYEKLGAKPMADWTTMRLAGDALQQMGAPEAA